MALHVECAPLRSDEWPWVARHLFFGLRDAEIEVREPFRLHGAEAVRTQATARLDQVPVEVEGVSVRHAGCLYDFLYVASPASFSQGRVDFEAFLQSWAPLPKD